MTDRSRRDGGWGDAFLSARHARDGGRSLLNRGAAQAKGMAAVWGG